MLTKEEEIYLAVLIAVSFLALILIFFIINLIINQRRIRKLQKALISAEIITLESERKRFSQDLHDEVGPNLSATLLYISALELKDEENISIRDNLEKIINISLEQIRSISRNITPKYLQEQGLETSVENLIMNYNQALNGRMTVVSDIMSIPLYLDEIENLNVYRIIQESINNAIKHSEAQEIRVHISITDTKMFIIISDNGRGFEFTSIKGNKANRGIGLKNIQSRVIFLGGQLNIYSQKGKGTQIVAEVPLLYDKKRE